MPPVTPAHQYECIIIGGGAAGLSAALVLGRCRRRTLVFDDGKHRNDPTPYAHSMLGHDGKPPHQIKEEAMAQLATYTDVEFCPDTVTSVTRADEAEGVDAEHQTEPNGAAGFFVEASGVTYYAHYLIIASGTRDILPPVPGIDMYWGRSVVHCPYCHGFEFCDQPTGYLANFAECFGFIELIYHWAGKLSVFTEGMDVLDADQRAQLAAHGVDVYDSPIAGLTGHNGVLQQTVLEDGTTVPISVLYIKPEQEKRHHYVQFPFEVLHKEPKRLLSQGQTDVPGLYIAGDAGASYQQLVGASYMGMLTATAVNGKLCKGRFSR